MATASLSTHVLDTGAGRPAPGVAVELIYGGEVIALRRRPTPTGARGSATSSRRASTGSRSRRPRAFFRRVELEIELADGHYHVPLLVSPYSCASYRGS